MYKGKSITITDDAMHTVMPYKLIIIIVTVVRLYNYKR